MKRVLFSLLCGALSIVGYFIFLGLLYQIFQFSFPTFQKLLLPIDLPYVIYKSIFGAYRGDPGIVKVLTLVLDVIVWAIPFYLIFTKFVALKAKRSAPGIETPPEPPVFH